MLQFKIQIKNVNNPTVWRRVIIPKHFNFAQFHEVIVAAFGWGGYHLYEFSPGGIGTYPVIGIPHDDYEDEMLDSKKMKVSKIFATPKQKFTYVYDFGDDWEHAITLEKITVESSKVADCIDGGGACPPEDCGGFPGYMDLKKILSNSKHPEYAGIKEWLGLSKKEKWDPEKFDMEFASEKVRRI